MSLDRAQSDLVLYWDSIDRWGYPDEWRNSGDPKVLKKTRPPIRESLLEELVSIAEYNNLRESWWDHVDPQGTLEEVVADLDDKFGLKYPPELRDKYGTTIEEREARFEDWQQERRDDLEEPPEKQETHERPPAEDPAKDRDNVTGRAIGAKSADEADDGAVVTSNESEYLEDTPKGTHGHATFSAPKPLIAVLDRLKDHRGLDSRRAAIEDMIASEELAPYFKDEDGNYWPEWVAAMEASKHLNSDTGD